MLKQPFVSIAKIKQCTRNTSVLKENFSKTCDILVELRNYVKKKVELSLREFEFNHSTVAYTMQFPSSAETTEV